MLAWICAVLTPPTVGRTTVSYRLTDWAFEKLFQAMEPLQNKGQTALLRSQTRVSVQTLLKKKEKLVSKVPQPQGQNLTIIKIQ